MPNTGDIVRASDFEAIKPQLSIGTVTTGAAGSNASASITGTSPNFKLNLTIPRGNTGATGATGPQGPSGTYTGPLKPTSAYWKYAYIPSLSNNASFTLPAGGTWAWYCPGADHEENPQLVTGIAAGGTKKTGAVYSIHNVLCWRIQ